MRGWYPPPMMTSEQRERLLGQMCLGVPMALAVEALGVTLDDLTAACEHYPLFGQAVDDAVFLQGRYRQNLERLSE